MKLLNYPLRLLSGFLALLKHACKLRRYVVTPKGFDPDLYLELNQDVKKAGVNPTTHYLMYGRHEGRSYSIPAIEVLEHNFKADRETILVVSHEASRSGAPILSLNLVQSFSGQYNVVALLLGGGPLVDAFRLAAAAVMISLNGRGNSALAYILVDRLCKRFNFKFAVVNSIESRTVLPALAYHFIPAISLIHEFATYTRPRESFRDALLFSSEAVFSTNVTLETAIAEYPDLGDWVAHILPQGRCLLPLEEFSEEQIREESARILRSIRPLGIADKSVIVLGAGFVQIRKGVELFIECAARVVHSPGGSNCRFVWIGGGYNPENDMAYSVYLADQIRRAGLQEHVLFIDETAAIETAYKEADLFLLSSRLDPLPNVAIDAMAHSLPVLCFNKATGIADFLIDTGLRDYCVAEYLDSTDMAKKISAFVGSRALRDFVAGRCLEASASYFNMQEYIARLNVLALDACVRTQQEKADTQMILSSGLFRRDFSCSPHMQGLSVEMEVRSYVRAWASGISRRKPFPGFHPGIYMEKHGLVVRGADPFVDYLRAGRPQGLWNYPVIVPTHTNTMDLPANQCVALHLHVSYPDLLPEITMRLSQNRICPDLFVSINNEMVRKLVVSQLRDYKGKIVDIQLVPNQGLDIDLFLSPFCQTILKNYEYIGYIHTKNGVDAKDATVHQLWYQFLLENLLGGESGSMADNILATMKEDTSIGMIFPDDPYVVSWGSNRAFASFLAVHLGLEKLPEYFIFPNGAMFWAKTAALLPLMNLKSYWNDFRDESLHGDGNALEAIAKLLSLSLSICNFKSVTTNVVGLTR